MNLNLKRVGMMLLIAIVFTLPPFSLSSVMKVSAQVALPRAASAALTNQDVLDILKMGLTQEVVIAKIKGSASNFDTSAKGLQELKSAGVSDAVILAMVQAEAPLPSLPSIFSPSTVSTPIRVAIPDGTAVEIELSQTASSEELKEGDPVAFKIVRSVEINGVTVIKRDASARGHVVKVKKAGRWGKQGKLDWAMNDAMGVDGTKIPLRFTQSARGDSKGGTVAVAAIATTVLLGPLGLLWGLKKGKPAIIPAGNKYTVYIDRESTVIVNGESAKP
jgi:hypothetical protein